MCGRYALWDVEELDRNYPQIEEVKPKLTPRYNAAPGQFLPVVTKDGLELMKWGLIPRWAKDPSSQGYTLINAKAETILEKPTYRNLLKDHRCIVPANGFFEWKSDGKLKTPHYITLKKRAMFGFAGLWDTWKDVEGKEFKSYVIITCEPNSFVAKIHNRMPVIITKTEEEKWLSDISISDTKLLDPYPTQEMAAYPISSLVNRVANDGPQIIYKLGK